jgi:hypothetical protein
MITDHLNWRKLSRLGQLEVVVPTFSRVRGNINRTVPRTSEPSGIYVLNTLF